MAAKRISQSVVNWAALAERVPENQKVFFIALKARSDNYLRRVLSNPEAPPKLDFSAYKGKIPIAGLVDSFQKQYDAVKVPYPADKLSSEIAAQESKAMQDIKAFVGDSNKRIAQNNEQIAKWDKVLPFEEMTLEDYKNAFPEQALDPINNPTLWPHTPEEQPGYNAKHQAAEQH